jgi:hypothetical protein
MQSLRRVAPAVSRVIAGAAASPVEAEAG